ncbi:MAG: hypothetical protein IPN03_05215 [Holophagales bacterium]|nr:hypothetical protein [Holophagales bacterium]
MPTMPAVERRPRGPGRPQARVWKMVRPGGEDLFERFSGRARGDVADARRADDEVAGADQDRAEPIEALGDEVLEAPLRLGAVESGRGRA